MALGKTTEARKEIEKIRSKDRGVPELPWNSELVDFFMIRSFIESGEWKEAAASCREWLKSRDDRPIIHALYAEALQNMRNYEAAHNHLQRAIDTEPKELGFWYADILVTWEGQNYRETKKAIKAVKELGGDKNLVERFSILCKARTEQDEKAGITMLQNAIRTLGPEPELMYALGEAYLKTGLLDEALSWFKKTIALKKDHEKAWLGQIAALENIINTDNSKAQDNELASLYEAYLKKWPDNSSIRRDRAMFLIKTFEYAEAASELEKLLIREPSNPSLRRVLAYTYRKTGRYREAAVFLKALLKEKPADLGILIEYAGCLERSGAGAYALLVLEKARELFNASAGASDRHSAGISNRHPAGVSDISLALGILNFKRKNLEKAFDYLREAASTAPKDSRPYEWMAAIARKRGDCENGIYYEEEAKRRKTL
jgi:tetratricopeptide (TPR) repeat protein